MKKTNLYENKYILEPDKWVPVDPENPDDKEFLDYDNHHLRPIRPSLSDMTQILEWPILKEDDTLFLSFEDRTPTVEDMFKYHIEDDKEYQNIYFAFNRDGYIKVYSRKKFDRSVSIRVMFSRFEE